MNTQDNPDNTSNGSPATDPATRPKLTEEVKRALLVFARQRLQEHLAQKGPSAISVDSEALHEHRATFVTWRTKAGELRGCIGEVIAQRSLVESVARMTVASGTQDPRFPPITTRELADLTVEISALTPMTSIEPGNVEVGRHGLMISKGHHSGLLLPQVPLEQGWNREEFLNGLCAKAGLPRGAWKDPGAQLRSFEAEVWGEEDVTLRTPVMGGAIPSIDVKIIRLEPMRVASVHVLGEEPEHQAWVKLHSWAAPKGLLDDLEKHTVYGFNNPNPTEEHKEYGYELWIRVDSDTEADGEIVVKDFPGGLYAVTSCKLMNDPNGNLPEVWMKLYEWVKASEYDWRKTQELEKPHDVTSSDEELILDLYLPIEG